MKRPALITVLFFIMGILLAYFFDISVFHLFLITGILLALCISTLFRWKSETIWAQTLLFAVLVSSGAFRYELSTRHFPANHLSHLPYFGRDLVLKGAVVSESQSLRGRTRAILAAREITYEGLSTKVCGKVLVIFRKKAGCHLAYGDVVLVRGRLRRPSPAKNPGAFNYRKYLLRRGIFGLLSVSSPQDIELVKSGKKGARNLYGLFFSRVILPIRSSIHRSIDRNLSGTPAAVLKGILLGEKGELPRQVRSAFADAGVIHVLAVSGLHVGLVVAIFFSVFRFLHLSSKWATVATLFALILYVFLTNLRPSVIRASIMAAVVLVGLALERNSDTLNNVALAALLILFIWPQALFEISFQLSFAATVAIVTLYRPILSLFPKSLRRTDRWWGKWVFGVIALSVAVQLGVAPITAFYFNRLPLVSVLANIVVIPLVGVILALGFLTSTFGFWCIPIATAFNATNWLFLNLLLKAIHLFARFPYGNFHVATPSWSFLWCYFVILVLFVQAQNSVRIQKILLFSVLVLGNIYLWRDALSNSREFRIVFLDPGRGNATFVEFPNGRKMLIDAGPRSFYFDAGEAVVLPFLRRSGIKRLDAVILTHQDNSRIGGLISVLKSLQVDNIVDNGHPLSSWTSDYLWRLVYQKGIHHWIASAGDTLTGLGDAELIFLAPFTPSRSPEYPLALKLTYRGVSFLLTGGSDQEETSPLLVWGSGLKATVLELQNSGIQDMSEERLVQAVSPQVLILTRNRKNPLWQGKSEILPELKTEIYTIEQGGAITITVDRKGKMKIASMLTGRKTEKYPKDK